jgi:transposase
MHYARILTEQGLKQQEIANRLGVSTRMVRKYLNPDFGKTQGRHRMSLLDPFKPTIDKVLEESPFFNLVLLARRLRKNGYAGGMSILREYAAGVRKEILTKAVLRFETEPGRQAQVDWKECGSWVLDGVEQKLYAFVMILGYSRKPFVLFTTSMRTPTLLSAHLKAFAAFGGVPHEILYDNMKTAWIYKETEWTVNPALLALASSCGFQPRRCQIRRPQTKGKVERFIQYLANHFLLSAHDQGISSLEDLNRAVSDWLVQVDGEAQREFCETRGERFEKEREHLRPWVAEAAPDVRETVALLVSREGRIRYETNRYSVPAQYIGKVLMLKIDPLTRAAELMDSEKSLRLFPLLPKGSHRDSIDSADTRSLWERWEKENRRKASKLAGSPVSVDPPPSALTRVAVAVRSPSWYTQFEGEGA